MGATIAVLNALHTCPSVRVFADNAMGQSRGGTAAVAALVPAVVIGAIDGPIVIVIDSIVARLGFVVGIAVTLDSDVDIIAGAFFTDPSATPLTATAVGWTVDTNRHHGVVDIEHIITIAVDAVNIKASLHIAIATRVPSPVFTDLVRRAFFRIVKT
tara:strand:+ start:1206 stop:1676 length:471 start_codon:yes stop_codon:yes gene_type:complete